MTWAIGLAVQQAAGTRSAHSSTASHLVSAHAARCGMIAAFMASKGYTCSEDTLESASGFAAVFASPPHLEAAVDRLGERYEITANAYKPYPAGIVNHAPIDACLQLAAEPGFDAAAVERVDLRVHPRVIQWRGLLRAATHACAIRRSRRCAAAYRSRPIPCWLPMRPSRPSFLPAGACCKPASSIAGAASSAR